MSALELLGAAVALMRLQCSGVTHKAATSSENFGDHLPSRRLGEEKPLAGHYTALFKLAHVTGGGAPEPGAWTFMCCSCRALENGEDGLLSYSLGVDCVPTQERWLGTEVPRSSWSSGGRSERLAGAPDPPGLCRVSHVTRHGVLRRAGRCSARKLCALLAFRRRPNPQRIDALFRRSGSCGASRPSGRITAARP